ncbi:MAG: NADAR family protein [Promethearchaeota archaeon]
MGEHGLKIDDPEEKLIDKFRGKYHFLSNFYLSPIEIDEESYPSVEHYFQCMKTTDDLEKQRIKVELKPSKAKQLGRELTLRPDWELIKIEIMEKALRSKFKIPELKEKLLDTGTATLQEGNVWGDIFWGVDVKTAKGQNHLGKLLMKIREEIR